MNSKHPSSKRPAEQVVKDIRRATRRHFSAEDKIRIVLEGLRGEDSSKDCGERLTAVSQQSSPIARDYWIFSNALFDHELALQDVGIFVAGAQSAESGFGLCDT